jgi:SulP family sulfate permease
MTHLTAPRVPGNNPLFLPKLVTTLRQGYGGAALRADLVAGLTVAIVALPLAMALAIASGATPDKGLLTVVVAGFLISALGGSRVQIGGPTGAFVVVVFNVIQAHGYDGLLLATLMAGVILVAAGLARLGTFVRYVPEPVVTGFTAGIAVIIFSSQVRDLLGLHMTGVPAGFIEKWAAFWAARDSLAPIAVLVSGLALLGIIALRKWAPRLPGFLIAVVAASLAVVLLKLPVETVGSRFGAHISIIPHFGLPAFSLEKMRDLAPSAFTIAFLAGIESLLSAVVADGMIGTRHRSNAELVAQGVANTASALFGGLPATGAIARTATNVRAGGRTPVAGMAHAVFVLIVMLAFAPLLKFIPLASLAAILVIVAWNMSEVERFRHLMRAPLGDRAVLLMTFGLTVMVDLTMAIGVGVVLAAIVFMHRMSQVTGMDEGEEVYGGDDAAMAEPGGADGVADYYLRGPLFFGSASGLSEMLKALITAGRLPKAFRLHMGQTPMIDASGVGVIRDFAERCRKQGVAVVLAEVQPQPAKVLAVMGLGPDSSWVTYETPPPA